MPSYNAKNENETLYINTRLIKDVTT